MCNESISLLRSKAAKCYETVFATTSGTVALGGVEKRTKKAKRWASACCHSLDYDARIQPSRVVLPYAHRVAQAAWPVVEGVVGEPLDKQTREQVMMPMPTSLGELVWPYVPGHICLARMANLVEQGPSLRAALWRRREHATAKDILSLNGCNQEADLLADASRMGAKLGPSGVPSTTSAADPLRPPTPGRHLLSAYLWFAAEKHHAITFAALDEVGRARLLSCGGELAGQFSSTIGHRFC